MFACPRRDSASHLGIDVVMRDVAALERLLVQIDEEIGQIFVALPQLWNQSAGGVDSALLNITRVRLSELEARRAIVLGTLQKMGKGTSADG
jgi:hypothetical protein